jgi:hypothetical protein
MCGAIPPPQYVFMAWCLVKRMYNFTFLHEWTSGSKGIREKGVRWERILKMCIFQ